RFESGLAIHETLARDPERDPLARGAVGASGLPEQFAGGLGAGEPCAFEDEDFASRSKCVSRSRTARPPWWGCCGGHERVDGRDAVTVTEPTTERSAEPGSVAPPPITRARQVRHRALDG